MEESSPHVKRMVVVYDYMQKHSEIVDAKQFFQFDIPMGLDTVTIWRGYTKQMAKEIEQYMKEHMAYKAVSQLILLDCITNLVHGNPSTYMLNKPPDSKQFNELKERSIVTGRYIPLTKWQQTQDQVNKLLARVNELETRLERIEVVQKSHALGDSSRRDGDVLGHQRQGSRSITSQRRQH